MFKNFKGISLVLVFILALSVVGCGKAEESDVDTQPNSNIEGATNGDDVLTQAVSDYYTNMGSDIYKIAQDKFVDKVNAEEDMFILDIRQSDAYAEGHIKGAVNAPWGTAISESLDKLPRSKTIMVYCYSGQTAGQTVALLNMAGFDAKSVNLGWNYGISKVEGVEAITETTPNEFGQPTGVEIDTEIKEAIDEYYSGLAEVNGTTYANYKISEDNAKNMLDQEDSSIMFLSIRKADDFAKGHIQGAENIPFGKEMHKEFNTLPKDKKIIVYCYTGQTAGQTVATLRVLGYDAVSLNGGTGMSSNEPLGWANKGFSLVK
ncbi:rhodanese-like domain-containing protein [Sporosalibacterium faouarense]|uniref:rhodanese-like domain-containing protein n=1 Tax=Sporosalibacterium faouarense TaxID=516123 RepID=UPI00192CDD3A|nr:rhodanese-like domain-containing protein [Sporosalibacterium faouarense]